MSTPYGRKREDGAFFSSDRSLSRKAPIPALRIPWSTPLEELMNAMQSRKCQLNVESLETRAMLSTVNLGLPNHTVLGKDLSPPPVVAANSPIRDKVVSMEGGLEDPGPGPDASCGKRVFVTFAVYQFMPAPTGGNGCWSYERPVQAGWTHCHFGGEITNPDSTRWVYDD